MLFMVVLFSITPLRGIVSKRSVSPTPIGWVLLRNSKRLLITMLQSLLPMVTGHLTNPKLFPLVTMGSVSSFLKSWIKNILLIRINIMMKREVIDSSLASINVRITLLWRKLNTTVPRRLNVLVSHIVTSKLAQVITPLVTFSVMVINLERVV